MSSYIFQRLAKTGKLSPQDKPTDSRAWMRDTASKIKFVNRNRLLDDPNNVANSLDKDSIGKMYTFFYDPKNKDTLPYYDQFPLIFMIGPKGSTGFLGINLHYLPPVLRAKLMDSLYDTINNKRYDETTKLRINYQILSSASRFRYFKPCVKHYLSEHVQSNFLNIEPRFWDAALMLPTEKFRKATAETVWNDSRSLIGS